MSVELTFINFPPMSQGELVISVPAELKNTGTESVRDVRLKVTDAVIFDNLHMFYTSVGRTNCLNYWMQVAKFIYNFDDGNFIFPADSVKEIHFGYVKIKEDAPIDIHDVQTDLAYTVI